MGSPPNAACAACKFQRRKCAADCLLAPWFPPDQPKRFASVHKLFGVANVLKLIRENQGGRIEDLIKSIVYEAEARERDPVNGAFGNLQLLHQRRQELERERERLTAIYKAMLVEEANAVAQTVYLPSHAPQLQCFGNLLGNNNSYQDYQAANRSFWHRQHGEIGTDSYYSGNMFPDHAQQQQSQNIQFLQPHLQQATSAFSQQHPEAAAAKADPMMMESRGDAPHYVRDFLSLGNNQDFFPYGGSQDIVASR